MSAIGFIGYPGTGKDAIAQELVSNHGYERIAFGDAVKQMLLDLDPTYKDSYKLLDYYKRRGYAYTREKLQNLGQRLRDYDEKFWIRSMPAVLADRAIVTDIRYPNELDWVKEKGGTVVAIHRPGFGPVNNHQSESNTTRLLELADITLTNHDTVAELAARFNTAL